MQTLLAMPSEQGKLDVGVSLALAPHEGLFWQQAENCVFRDGEVRSMRGSSELTPSAEQILLLEQGFATSQFSPNDRARRVYFATPTTLVAKTETALQNVFTTRTIASGLSSPIVSMATFGNWLIYTDAVSVLKLWKNAATSTDLTASIGASRIRLVKRLGPHIIALGLDDESERIAWASADNPEDWIATPENSAGDLHLRDLGSAIIGAQNLGPDLAIYAKDSMGVLQYLGAPLYFGFDRRLDSIGAIGPNAVCAVGHRNFGIASSGIWETDGLEYQFIDRPAMWKFLEENVNWAQAQKCVAFHWEVEHQVVFSFPGLAQTVNTFSLGYDYKAGTWTYYAFGIFAGVERNVFDYPLVAKLGTGVRLFGAANASDVAARVRAKPLSFGEEDVYKHISEFRTSFSGSATARLFVQETLDASPELYHEAALTRLVTPIPRESPYWFFEIEGTEFRLSAVKVQGELTGFVV